jgi:large subunit ribosomal protein L9
MRVILTQNVPKLGVVGDVCHVAAGYGRNYLIPQALAVMATPGALKQVDGLKRAEERRQDLVRAEMTEFGHRIARVRLEFKARVGETGRLYGSITSSDIAEGVEARLGEEIDRRKILLDESIRTLGEHIVPIRLMPGVDTQVTVIVVPEEDIDGVNRAPASPDDAVSADADVPDGAEDAGAPG